MIKQNAHELMELHVEAAFTHDQNLCLRSTNEPWSEGVPAPRFFLGRTMEGTIVCRFRYDVPDDIVHQLVTLCEDEPPVNDFMTKPKHFEAYMDLLGGQKFSMGPCYLVPVENKPSPAMMPYLVNITRQNIDELTRNGFEWLIEEIDYVHPCVAIVIDNQAVSICRSVRISPRAHEAGVETLSAYRGRGYASEVVAEWAMAVRKAGCIPLYSTSCENLSSQSVARKSKLKLYGVNFSIT